MIAASGSVMADHANDLAEEPFGNVAETHSAVVFFAGSRAYKLKKEPGIPRLHHRRGQGCRVRARNAAEQALRS